MAQLTDFQTTNHRPNRASTSQYLLKIIPK